jgi:hypothetical protein
MHYFFIGQLSNNCQSKESPNRRKFDQSGHPGSPWIQLTKLLSKNFILQGIDAVMTNVGNFLLEN